MRHSIAALALFEREHQAERNWLAQWSQTWGCFSLIGGHKLPAESFRECCLREIAEELSLTPEIDFEVAAKPCALLRYKAWSQRAQQETDYEIEVFAAWFLRVDAALGVAADPANRWLQRGEILAQRTDDGRPITATFARVFQALGWGDPPAA